MNHNDLSEMRLRKADERAAMRAKPDPDAESVESFLARGGVIQELPPCTFGRDALGMNQRQLNADTWRLR